MKTGFRCMLVLATMATSLGASAGRLLAAPADNDLALATLRGPFTLTWKVESRLTYTPEQWNKICQNDIRGLEIQVKRGMIERADADRRIARLQNEISTGVSRAVTTQTLTMSCDGTRFAYLVRRPGEKPDSNSDQSEFGNQTCLWDGKSTFCLKGGDHEATVGHYFSLDAMRLFVLPGVNLPFLPFYQGTASRLPDGTFACPVLYSVTRQYKQGWYLDGVIAADDRGQSTVKRVDITANGSTLRTVLFADYRNVGGTWLPGEITVENFEAAHGKPIPASEQKYTLEGASQTASVKAFFDPEAVLASAGLGFAIEVTDDHDTLAFPYDRRMGSLEDQIKLRRLKAGRVAPANPPLMRFSGYLLLVLLTLAGAVYFQWRRSALRGG